MTPCVRDERILRAESGGRLFAVCSVVSTLFQKKCLMKARQHADCKVCTVVQASNTVRGFSSAARLCPLVRVIVSHARELALPVAVKRLVVRVHVCLNFDAEYMYLGVARVASHREIVGNATEGLLEGSLLLLIHCQKR